MRTGEYYQRMRDVPAPMRAIEHEFTGRNREERRQRLRKAGISFDLSYSRELHTRLGEQWSEHFAAKKAMRENARLAAIVAATQ